MVLTRKILMILDKTIPKLLSKIFKIIRRFIIKKYQVFLFCFLTYIIPYLETINLYKT